MITRKLLYLILLLVAVNNNSFLVVNAQREQSTVAGGAAPGEGDIAIMQKEIKWGMQEMQRYKTLRGAWPVRPVANIESELENIFARDRSGEENGSMRGKKPKETPHSTYWKLLVSVF